MGFGCLNMNSSMPSGNKRNNNYQWKTENICCKTKDRKIIKSTPIKLSWLPKLINSFVILIKVCSNKNKNQITIVMSAAAVFPDKRKLQEGNINVVCNNQTLCIEPFLSGHCNAIFSTVSQNNRRSCFTL